MFMRDPAAWSSTYNMYIGFYDKVMSAVSRLALRSSESKQNGTNPMKLIGYDIGFLVVYC